jgi:lysozyme
MLNLVADLSHYSANSTAANGELDFREAYQDGLRAIIHKATEGVSECDRQYETRKLQARRAGLLWGAYHVDHADDGEAQARHFLACVNPDPHTLLVLVFEQSREGGLTMTTPQAEEFVQHVHQHTGRYPGLYSNPAYLHLTQAHLSPTLRQCWLWLASYEKHEEPPLPPGWPHWTLWQYTNGHLGWPPHAVSGFGLCNRSQFNGQLDDLRQLWGYPVAAAPAPQSVPMAP